MQSVSDNNIITTDIVLNDICNYILGKNKISNSDISISNYIRLDLLQNITKKT